MFVLSLTRPESLHRYLGMQSTPSAQPVGHDADSVHDSSNKSLHPTEYLKQCAKMYAGFMHHGDYWDDMGLNMHHTVANEPSLICSSTITYMLDGTVGLTADLALMAQAAALAREVNQCPALPFS
jgi:hypothetical protein